MIRADNPTLAARRAADMAAASYVRLEEDGTYTIHAAKPPSPPYVAASPGDDISLVLERIRRLAGGAAVPRGDG